jgi:hypothetical protein
LFPFPVKGPPVQSPVKAPPVSPQLTLPSFSYGLGGAPDKNSKQTDLGEKTIEGVRTVGSRVEYTLPAGEIGNEKPIVITAEQWFSPDLGVVVASVQHSTAGNESTYKLEQIQREEQDRELFSVPSDYTKQDVNSQGVFRMQSAPATAAPPPPPQ